MKPVEQLQRLCRLRLKRGLQCTGGGVSREKQLALAAGTPRSAAAELRL